MSLTINRLKSERNQLLSNPSEGINAYPIKNDFYNWHFTFQGPEDTEYEGGYYHGHMKIPVKYPFEPPDILFLNPNGRFEIN